MIVGVLLALVAIAAFVTFFVLGRREAAAKQARQARAEAARAAEEGDDDTTDADADADAEACDAPDDPNEAGDGDASPVAVDDEGRQPVVDADEAAGAPAGDVGSPSAEVPPDVVPPVDAPADDEPTAEPAPVGDVPSEPARGGPPPAAPGGAAGGGAAAGGAAAAAGAPRRTRSRTDRPRRGRGYPETPSAATDDPDAAARRGRRGPVADGPRRSRTRRRFDDIPLIDESSPADEWLRSGELRMSTVTKQVLKGDAELTLSPSERSVLEVLLRSGNAGVTPDAIRAAAGDVTVDPDAIVAQLRTKTGLSDGESGVRKEHVTRYVLDESDDAAGSP